MKKITVDYIFRTSPKILFKRLSTVSGLNEWFADDVTVEKDVITFHWKNYSQSAKMKTDNKKYFVRFDWVDEPDKYLEFSIEKSTMSKDLTLYITDFVEDYEGEEGLRDLWDNTIKRLKRKLGLS
jgi:uncharacterized protein YndB with AHSA1/START domain